MCSDAEAYTMAAAVAAAVITRTCLLHNLEGRVANLATPEGLQLGSHLQRSAAVGHTQQPHDTAQIMYLGRTISCTLLGDVAAPQQLAQQHALERSLSQPFSQARRRTFSSSSLYAALASMPYLSASRSCSGPSSCTAGSAGGGEAALPGLQTWVGAAQQAGCCPA
jgi:hypothetical protein